jgi:hypothetical protein
MRENRTYGSEGGEAKSLPYPYQRRNMTQHSRGTNHTSDYQNISSDLFLR